MENRKFVTTHSPLQSSMLEIDGRCQVSRDKNNFCPLDYRGDFGVNSNLQLSTS